MKTKITLLLLLFMVIPKLKAQETTVVIKILDTKNGDYFIQVADRNCGANSNSINSYGDYYSWSTGQKSSDKKVSDEAAKACMEFRGGGYTDWRLPSSKEILAIMNRCKLEENYATLKNERGDASVIFLPYAGMISGAKMGEVSGAGEIGYFWGAEGFRSNSAISMMLSKLYYNNPLEVKINKLSVRCIRPVK